MSEGKTAVHHRERQATEEDLPKLVILGSGFGAFRLLKQIDLSLYQVTVVSPRNHFLFTPLLTSTTVGTIEFRSIIEPIRSARKGVTFYQAPCTKIDVVEKRLHCEEVVGKQIFTLEYDILVIAVGATSNTYGIPGVEKHCFFLREAADARRVRQRIIETLERASSPVLSPDERDRLLHFVVVGGGPTGVEFAGEMHDFIRDDLRKWYPKLVPRIRITLIEASSELLSSFQAKLRAHALKSFRKHGIEVRTNAFVQEVRENSLFLETGEVIQYGMAVWSGGIAPVPLVESLNLEKDEEGRLITDHYLAVKGTAGVYSIGDCSTLEMHHLPATAQVAQQQGRYLGNALNRKARGQQVAAFSYRDLGMLVYIGSRRALADLSRVSWSGFTAWLFWRSVYLTKLVSFKNKVLVFFDWIQAAIFGRDISRF